MKNKCTKFRNYRPYTAKSLGTWKMFDNPTDNHTDIEVPLYYELRFTKLKILTCKIISFAIYNWKLNFTNCTSLILSMKKSRHGNAFHNTGPSQCWKFPQARQSEADNFGGGPGTFCWFFFNFMFMICNSSNEDLQLFWLSFKHWTFVRGIYLWPLLLRKLTSD